MYTQVLIESKTGGEKHGNIGKVASWRQGEWEMGRKASRGVLMRRWRTPPAKRPRDS